MMVCRGEAPLFVVLGDDLRTGGVTRRAMEAKVAELGLSSRFVFLGFRRDAPRVVQAFDVIAVPSHVEPLGNATLEAMAAGVPPIVTRVGAIPDVVTEGVHGLFVRAHDPVAISHAIQALDADRELLARMGAACRKRVSGAYSLERLASDFYRPYSGSGGMKRMPV